MIEWEKRKVSPDMVRSWIRPDYVFESAGRDLIIVGGITPTTEAVTWIVIEDIGIVHVLRVWMKIAKTRLEMAPAPN